MKIAAQLYTLRDYCKTPDEIYESLKKLQTIGFQSVQVSGIGEIEPKLLKSFVDECGMTICATHNSFDRIVHDTDQLIKDHEIFDCDIIGIGSMPGEFNSSLEKCQEFLDLLAPALKKIKAAGKKFTYHNHYWEFAKFDGKTTMDYMIEHTDPSEFGLLVDTYWLQYSGLCPAEFILKHGDRIDVVHYKDLEIAPPDFKARIAPVGEGNMAWEEITRACEQAGVQVAAIEQDTCHRDPFDCMASSYHFMKDKLGLQ